SKITWLRVADLLWFASGIRGSAETGRAGIPIYWSPAPSAGGLSCLHIVCIQDDGSAAKLYDPLLHRFLVLSANAARVARANSESVEAVLGSAGGCTLRLVGDWGKLSAAYFNAES